MFKKMGYLVDETQNSRIKEGIQIRLRRETFAQETNTRDLAGGTQGKVSSRVKKEHFSSLMRGLFKTYE